MRIARLAIFVVLCYGAAGLGGALTSPGLPWLATLQKPAFNPPDWVFGPVWTVLYGLMAVSGWLVHATPPSRRRTQALSVFALQLCLNVAWSGLFFYLHRPGWSFAEVCVLLGTIWFYVVLTWPIERRAAWLFVPYGLWVAFATVLNAAIWRLNR